MSRVNKPKAAAGRIHFPASMLRLIKTNARLIGTTEKVERFVESFTRCEAYFEWFSNDEVLLHYLIVTKLNAIANNEPQIAVIVSESKSVAQHAKIWILGNHGDQCNGLLAALFASVHGIRLDARDSVVFTASNAEHFVISIHIDVAEVKKIGGLLVLRDRLREVLPKALQVFQLPVAVGPVHSGEELADELELRSFSELPQFEFVFRSQQLACSQSTESNVLHRENILSILNWKSTAIKDFIQLFERDVDANCFKALGNWIRFRIIVALLCRSDGLNVGELTEIVGCSMPHVSKALSDLGHLDFVHAVRHANSKTYFCNREELESRFRPFIALFRDSIRRAEANSAG